LAELKDSVDLWPAEGTGKHLFITSHRRDRDAFSQADNKAFLSEPGLETLVLGDSTIKEGVLHNKGSPNCAPALAN
jgi:hypothetical protein